MGPQARQPLGRPFGAHLGGVGLANLADGIVQTGVPLLAITLTRSPLLIGVLTAAVWLPWLVCGIPAGVLVDRWDRRRTMQLALLLRAALLGAAAVLAGTGRLTIWVLVVLALAYGVTEVFTDLAAQAQVPALVGRDAERLRSATSRLLAVQAFTNGFAGPPLAGALLVAGAAWLLGAPALVVALAVMMLSLGLRGRYAAPRPEVGRPQAIRQELVEGMTTLWRHPVLRPLLIGAGLWNFASTAFSAVIVLWMVGPGSAGGLTPQVWALVVVAMPVGALVGSLLAGRVLRRWPEMSVLVVCWGANGVLNLLPLLWPSALTVVVFLLLIGPLGVIGNVVSGAIRPRMVPEHLLGKVGGAARVVGYGAMPLGALVGGQVAELYGIPLVLGGVVVVMILSTLLVWRRVPQSLVDEHELAPSPTRGPGAGVPAGGPGILGGVAPRDDLDNRDDRDDRDDLDGSTVVPDDTTTDDRAGIGAPREQTGAHPTRSSTSSEPDSADRRVRPVTVRRRPRLLAFLVVGALVGAVAGGLLGYLGPQSPSSSLGQDVVLLAFVGALFFGLAGAIAYLVADRVSLSRDQA